MHKVDLGHVGTEYSASLRFIMVAFLWRDGEREATANMSYPFAQSRSDVSVRDESHCSPEGSPGLFLKLYIIVLLQGRPSFNIRIIPLCLGQISYTSPSMHTYIVFVSCPNNKLRKNAENRIVWIVTSLHLYCTFTDRTLHIKSLLHTFTAWWR